MISNQILALLFTWLTRNTLEVNQNFSLSKRIIHYLNVEKSMIKSMIEGAYNRVASHSFRKFIFFHPRYTLTWYTCIYTYIYSNRYQIPRLELQRGRKLAAEWIISNCPIEELIMNFQSRLPHSKLLFWVSKQHLVFCSSFSCNQIINHITRWM